MRIDRRRVLGLIGASAAAPATSAHARQAAAAVAFRHGVASGDPLGDRVMLWTRVTPDRADAAVSVDWRIRPLDSDAVVASGVVETGPERDYTVKVDVGGLQPGADYRFDFAVGDVRSPEGRTRTLPAGGTEDVVLAVASCQLHPGGLFNAYEAMAGLERLDAVVHLGDYIYEYGAEADDYGMVTGAALNRVPEPAHEIVSLDDYRRRHAQYKTDADLQAAHARAPFICVWDDHEVTNDNWTEGAQNHQPRDEGDYGARKAAALRAYYEWMPIREPQGGLSMAAVNRTFHFGDLATLVMVETRLTARDEPIGYATHLPMTTDEASDPIPDVAGFEAIRNDPARELMGAGQIAWLKGELEASRLAGRPWQIIGNQVVMARVAGPNVADTVPPAMIEGLLAQLPDAVRAQVQQSIQLFRFGLPFNLDSWDGYPAERERLYAAFAEAGVSPIVLAGDSHAFWVNELKDAAGQRRAVEFGTSAISSPSPGDAIPALPLGPALAQTNEEVVFCDQSSKGFVLLTLTREQATAELKAVSTILAKPFEVRDAARFTVARSETGAGDLTQA